MTGSQSEPDRGAPELAIEFPRKPEYVRTVRQAIVAVRSRLQARLEAGSTPVEAAILGGKVYLAAYAQRLGASGLTFFDDDVTEFFSPHAVGKSVMFLIAIGKSAKQKKLSVS